MFFIYGQKMRSLKSKAVADAGGCWGELNAECVRPADFKREIVSVYCL